MREKTKAETFVSAFAAFGSGRFSRPAVNAVCAHRDRGPIPGHHGDCAHPGHDPIPESRGARPDHGGRTTPSKSHNEPEPGRTLAVAGHTLAGASRPRAGAQAKRGAGPHRPPAEPDSPAPGGRRPRAAGLPACYRTRCPEGHRPEKPKRLRLELLRKLIFFSYNG